jgi:serine/threonine protein phosphatase 1
MATFAVGDVHGNLAALEDVLRQIAGECTEPDCVVFLGDYIHRGLDTNGCIDAILRFQRECRAEVVCLLGNHEDWFLRTLRDYERHTWLCGMNPWDTIRSYSAEAASTLRKAASVAGLRLYQGRCRLPYEVFYDAVPAEHLRFFEDLRVPHRTADGLYTHGGLDPRIASLPEQPRDAPIWGAGTFPDGYEGDETVVYGHRNNAVLDADEWPSPRTVGRTVGIDTISHGVLTALRLPDGRLFQSARYATREPGA